MKTAEEILSQYIATIVNVGQGEIKQYDNFYRKSIVLQAMEQYASEQCQKRDEIIKAQDELIGFYERLIKIPQLDSVLHNKIEQLKRELQ